MLHKSNSFFIPARSKPVDFFLGAIIMDGFVFYGFDPGSTEEFLVVFNNDYEDGLAVAEATSDL